MYVLTVLPLFKELSQTNTTVQQLLSGGIQIRTELSEGSHLTVLGQLQFHGTSHLMIARNRHIRIKVVQRDRIGQMGNYKED